MASPFQKGAGSPAKLSGRCCCGPRRRSSPSLPAPARLAFSTAARESSELLTEGSGRPLRRLLQHQAPRTAPARPAPPAPRALTGRRAQAEPGEQLQQQQLELPERRAAHTEKSAPGRAAALGLPQKWPQP